MNGGATWWRCVIKYIVGKSGVVMACDCPGGEQYVHFEHYNSETEQFKFRLIRNEADRKRDEACKAMTDRIDMDNYLAGIIYDDIAAGKIPHITLK